MSHTDSMLNINTTYFLSNQNDSIYWLKQAETDSFTLCTPGSQLLPYTFIKDNGNLTGNLCYTVVFLIIFAFIRLRGKDLLPNLLNILIKRKKAEVIQNEGISSNLVCYILSLCLSFSILTIGVTYLAWENFITLYSLYAFAGLLLYHFFLLLLVRFLGWTFNARATADEFIVNIWTYHILSGLLIAPFIISVLFVKAFAILPLLKIVIFGLILLMIAKMIRWIEILFLHRVSILYMILYLCAFEFMPLLILYKIAAY